MQEVGQPVDVGLRPPRLLGPIDATCVVIGAIIGVGIFFNPSQVAALCPSISLSLLAWGIAGAIALCGALAFAELGGMYRGSGAQYTLLRDSYGSFPAFLFGFCLTTIIVPGSTGVIAVVCAENILAAAGWSASAIESTAASSAMSTSLIIAIALIIALMLANIIGVRWGSTIQNITSYAKVLALLAVTGLAMFFAPDRHVESAVAVEVAAAPSRPILVGVLAALVPTLFAFGGWQQVLWMAGEVREPRRNLPRAIVIGVLIVITVYLLVNWAYLRLLGVEGVATSQALAADAVGVVWPDFGRRMAAAVVAISAFGVLNVQLLTAPRLIFGMARDGRFFHIFASLNPRFGTPVAAIMLIAIMSLGLLLIAGKDAVDQLVAAVVMVDSVFFVLTGLAVIVLRRTRPDADRPMRVPGYPIVPLLFVIGEIGVIIGGSLNESVRFAALGSAAWIAIAAAVYWTMFRNADAPSTQ